MVHFLTGSVPTDEQPILIKRGTTNMAGIIEPFGNASPLNISCRAIMSSAAFLFLFAPQHGSQICFEIRKTLEGDFTTLASLPYHVI